MVTTEVKTCQNHAVFQTSGTSRTLPEVDYMFWIDTQRRCIEKEVNGKGPL
jgi:hypothetical protein